MRKSGFLKQAVVAGMLMISMGVLCSCGLRQVPSDMDKVGGGAEINASTDTETVSEDKESRESAKQESVTDADGKDTEKTETVAITEDDLRRLIAGNIKCNAWFGYSSLRSIFVPFIVDRKQIVCYITFRRREYRNIMIRMACYI